MAKNKKIKIEDVRLNDGSYIKVYSGIPDGTMVKSLINAKGKTDLGNSGIVLTCDSLIAGNKYKVSSKNWGFASINWIVDEDGVSQMVTLGDFKLPSHLKLKK